MFTSCARIVCLTAVAFCWVASSIGHALPVPVQYWLVDEGTGATGTNQIPTGNTGTLVDGVSWVTSGLDPTLTGRSYLPSTAALSLNPDVPIAGSHGYFDAGDIGLDVSGSGTATLSMFVNPTSLSGDNRLYGQLSGLTSQAGAAHILSSGALEIWSGTAWQPTGLTLTSGTWQHVALVANSGTISAYLNGAFTGSATSNFNFSGTSLGIGARFIDTYGTGFYGLLDEVAAFDVALTSGEIGLIAAGQPLLPNVPEPATLALLFGSGFGLLGLRRRTRRRLV